MTWFIISMIIIGLLGQVTIMLVQTIEDKRKSTSTNKYNIYRIKKIIMQDGSERYVCKIYIGKTLWVKRYQWFDMTMTDFWYFKKHYMNDKNIEYDRKDVPNIDGTLYTIFFESEEDIHETMKALHVKYKRVDCYDKQFD